MKKNYDLSALMTYAWEIFRNPANKCETFAEALKRAWKAFDVAPMNHERFDREYAKSGTTEKVKTWFAWTKDGRKVKHGEKALFQVLMDIPEKGIGKTYLVSYFTESQTDLAENVA